MPRKKRKTSKRTSKKKTSKRLSKADEQFAEEIKRFAQQEFKGKTIKVGDLVKIDYSLTTPDGIIIDTSIGFEADNCGVLDSDREYKPIEIIVGNNETLKGIDKALIGMHEGEEKTFVLKPEDAFGKYDKRKVKKFKLKMLNFKHVPIAGESVALVRDGKASLGIIREAYDGVVIVDFNHPLAGKKLVCSLKVLQIYD